MEREFDSLFEKYGQRLEWLDPHETFIRDLRSAARQWCDQTVSTEYRRNDRKIYLDLVESRAVNACANSATDDFIAINRGTVDTLLGVFGHLISHPSTWTRVGSPQAESVDRALGPSLFLPSSETTLRHIVPRCVQRQHFTVNLTTLAFHFLVMHEVAHLRNGHVDMLKNLGIQELSEVGSSQEPTGDSLLRQTLEVDADSYAAAKSLGFAIERVGVVAGEDGPAAGAFRDAYGDYERALHTLAVSIFLLFRIFAPRDGPIENVGMGTHPPSWLRLRCTYCAVGEAVGKITAGRVSSEQFFDYAADAIVEVEEAIAKISSRSVDLRWAMAAFDEESVTVTAAGYLDEVSKKWREIRPELDQLKRGGVLPR